MALWDSFADQMLTLPVAASIDAANDRLVYAGATRQGAQASALNNVPHTLVWLLNASAANTNPTASTTARKDGFRSPYAMTLVRLHLTLTTAYSSGAAPGFDLYNETDAVSVLDNTANVNSVIVPGVGATIVTDDPIDVPALAVNKAVGWYCHAASATNIGSTWGHLMYVL
jgi:hypothetical protein